MSATDTTASSRPPLPAPSPRKPMSARVTGVIWGAIVATVGGFVIAALSGYDVDLELLAIIALAALGAWLLFSAISVGMRQSRRERAAATPAGPDNAGSETALNDAQPTDLASTEPGSPDRRDARS